MVLNDRYEYNPATDLLGKGGLAEVFKAYDKQTGRYVAIKKFTATDETLKYSLKNEFQKSLHLAHDNLVRAYDFFTVVRTFADGETHETQYGVMELIEGGDLNQYLQSNPPNEELLQVVKGILQGLHYLHTPNTSTDKGIIIHRDIKPGNILIYRNKQGQPIPKITDFNIAKEAAATTEHSQSMVGTYEYMAPEQLNPKKYGIDGKLQPNADLWALGVILYDYFNKDGASLFGKRAHGDSEGHIISNILDKPIPADAIKKLPAPFNGIIARCLERPAQNRIESAQDLLNYLASLEETTLPVSPPPMPAPPASYPKLPKPWEKVLLLGALLVTVAVIVYNIKTDLNSSSSQGGTEPSSPPFEGGAGGDTSGKDIFASQMVFVQGGTYTMGCLPERDGDCADDEKPAHEVTVSNFYISKYEVTQAQWQAIMGTLAAFSNPSFFDGCPQCPVESVSWGDIQEFLQKLNAQTGKNYRLPTEAEWEYAARGGNKSKGYKYAGSNDIDRVAWYNYNSINKTHPVGQKSPNELGLYDMTGNVWEWCSDRYDNEYYATSPSINPKGPASGSYRVLRGGSWYRYPLFCRVAYRGSHFPSSRDSSYGFRLVCVPQ